MTYNLLIASVKKIKNIARIMNIFYCNCSNLKKILCNKLMMNIRPNVHSLCLQIDRSCHLVDQNMKQIFTLPVERKGTQLEQIGPMMRMCLAEMDACNHHILYYATLHKQLCNLKITLAIDPHTGRVSSACVLQAQTKKRSTKWVRSPLHWGEVERMIEWKKFF